jgi:hypothetical protein
MTVTADLTLAHTPLGPSLRDRAAGVSPSVPTLLPEHVGRATPDALVAWLEGGARDEVLAATHGVGAVLLRGFGVLEPADFERIAVALDPAVEAYEGGATDRDAVSARAYEASRYPGVLHLPIHSETCYLRRFPRRLFFCCPTVARRGGETTLADNRAVLAALPEDVRRRFEARGVGYVRNALSRDAGWRLRFARALGSSAVQTWQDMFETDDREQVERFCRERDMACTWRSDGSLSLNDSLPATRVHPDTGEAVWFNQAHIFHTGPSRFGLLYPLIRLLNGGGSDALYHCTYGDGQALPEADIRAVRRVLAEHERPHAWEAGDVLVVDNLLAGHGRRSFRGSRSVWFAQAI